MQAAIAAAQPTPDLEATVQAAVAAALPTPTPTTTPDIDATVEARMAATLAAIPTPTSTPLPTAIPTPTPLPTSTPTPTPRPTPTPTPTPIPTATPAPTPTRDSAAALSEMVRQARPAVVRIQTASGSGSGVIFETQYQTGYVVTNHHVVEGSAQVSVVVNDSITYRGAVLGTDAVRDLAVVRICCGSFRALPFGDAAALEPGYEVVNIGYALGLPGEATVTRGIVSAVRYDPEHRSDVIQTDAAINPGNSGGPMLSTAGEILGINTFVISETGSGRSTEGLGFAISGTTVRQQAPVLQAAAPSPTPTPTRRPSPTPWRGQTGDFGPMSGDLRHDPSEGFIKTEYANVSVADFVVEATFSNPYSGADHKWDYGFFLRDHRRYDSPDPFIQVSVTSDRRWYLGWRETSDSPNQRLGGGTVTHLDISAAGRNHLRVVAIGERGWLFVNDRFISNLDLSPVTGAGDVAAITGAFAGDEVAGAVTGFEGFQGDRLTRRYGPADGNLEHKEDIISAHDSGVWTRDLVAEAEFVNPQGNNWDYGFIIRNPRYNRLEVIGLTDSAWWFHYARDVGDTEYTDAASGYLSESGISLQSRNRLTMIAFEDAGWFFVNGWLVAKLDLSHNLDSGDVSAMGGFFNNHTGEPSFEEFSVWTP